jgi:hypothetical protein
MEMEFIINPPPLEDVIPPPDVFIPQLPLHHVHKIYQYPKTRKTEEMMETMAKQNKIPSVMIHDPFIENNVNKISFCTKDFIEEWVRTTQILLFDQFQESMRNWTEITKEMKREILSIKYERKKSRHWHAREQMETRAQQIDCDQIQKLPDDIIHIIWNYVDDEVRNKYYLGKYCFEEPIFKNMLQRLNFQTLKILYKKTAFCYHGLCMQKIIPSERYNNPPVSRKNKQDFIKAITQIMDDYLNMYSDMFVFTTYQKYGQLLSKKEGYIIENEDYFGMVYPLDFYEKRTLQLWKHLAVAFSLFLPNDYYAYLHQRYYVPFLQPLISPSSQSNLTIATPPLPDSPPITTPPESPLGFVFL